LIGALIITVSLINNLSLPLGETLEILKTEGKTNPLNFSFDTTQVSTVWTGVIAMTLFHITVYGANQMMVQRTLASKNIGDAKKSFLMMGYLAIFIYFLFFLLGILFYSYYGGRDFDNGNTIILDFASSLAIPGLMGIIAAAVIAASMSSLDSAFNSMSTVTTIDFYQKYVKADATSAHYLAASRLFTIFWALAIIIPAFMYTKSNGSVLETLSKVGSYFVGAKLAMFGLGFFSKHTTEKGLITGVIAGFGVLWWVASNTDIAWPWYCAIGGIVNISVSIGASLIIDGRQAEYSRYSVQGQKQYFSDNSLPEKENGWYLVPGRIDKQTYWLLVYFGGTVAGLYLFNQLI
jgi:SSS family solute:Na+ symporter